MPEGAKLGFRSRSRSKLLATDPPSHGGSKPIWHFCLSRDLEVTGVDQLWGMLSSGAPPVRMLLERVGSQGESKLRDTLAKIIEQRFGSGPFRLSNVATVGCGVVG